MLISILILFVLMLLNGVFAMTELAMMTSRNSRLQAAADKGSRGAAAALKLAAEPTRLLSTVQVAITLIGILAGAYGEKSLASGLREILGRSAVLAPYAEIISLLVVVLGITYTSLVVGELVPKRLALAYPELVASLIARPLSLLSWVMAAPVKVLTVSTEFIVKLLRIKPDTGQDVSVDDVRAIAARAAQTGTFDLAEHEVVQGALAFGNFTARDLMVPRPDVVFIEAGTPSSELKAIVGSNPYSHFPVARGDLDHLVGVVHIKDLIAYGLIAGAEFDITEVAQPALHVPESVPAGKLLDTLRRHRTHLAIVTDEHGGAAGIVTLNDITRAIIGDVLRPGESVEEHVSENPDGTLSFDGRFPAANLPARLGLPLTVLEDVSGVSTLGGVIMMVLGHLPKVGDHADWHGWRLTVTHLDGRRIATVKAARVDPDPGTPVIG